MKPMNVIIYGSKGRMGQTLCHQAEAEGAQVVAAIDEGDSLADSIKGADVIIDFSFHTATANMVSLAAQHGIPVVIGTTGHTEEEKEAVLQHTKTIPIVWAGNYSVGVNTLFYLTQKAAEILGKDYQPEITEIHHRHKKDAPSGTAINLAEFMQQASDFKNHHVQHGREGETGERPEREIGMHALRGGEVVGEHTVFFFGKYDRIELTHRAADRGIFASGAYRAARWTLNQKPGLYNMRDVLNLT